MSPAALYERQRATPPIGCSMQDSNAVVREVDRLNELARVLEAEPTLHFVLPYSALKKVAGSAPLVIKKCLLYSSRTIILTPPVEYATPTGDYRENVSTNWLIRPTAALAAFGIPITGAIAEDLIVELPESIVEKYEVWSNDDFYEDPPRTLFNFADSYGKVDSLQVLLADPVLGAQFAERLRQIDFSVINLWLPTLSGVSITDLLKLRLDEYDAFTRMHVSLRRFAATLPSIGSEAKLKELMQEVDLQVRKLDERFTELKKRHSRSLAEAAVGVAVVGLLLLVPAEIGRLLSAFIGSYQTKEFIQSVFRYREQLHDLKASDFYAAWRTKDLIRLSKDDF